MSTKLLSMKVWINSLFAVLIVFGACSDESRTIENFPVGKWKLKEIFDGYANGGTFTWNDVPNGYSEIIEFTYDLKYSESFYSFQHQKQCTGSYRILSDDLIEIESSCQTVVYQIRIDKVNQTTLVINRQGREGVIRFKYALLE